MHWHVRSLYLCMAVSHRMQKLHADRQIRRHRNLQKQECKGCGQSKMAAHFELTSAHLPTLTHTTPSPLPTHTHTDGLLYCTLYKEPSCIFSPICKGVCSSRRHLICQYCSDSHYFNETCKPDMVAISTCVAKLFFPLYLCAWGHRELISQ